MWYNQIGLGLEHGLWGRKSPPLEKQNSPCFCSRVEWHRRGRLHYLSFLSQSVNHFLTLASNHKLLGLSSWFSFCAWPWIQPHMFTKSKWGGAFTPVLVVFYQLISNTWSHANPLTPLAVSAHTNRNKHTETHYINCLFSPALIILQCLPSPLFFPAPVFPCFCYLSSSFRSMYFVLSHSLYLYCSFHASLLPIFWQPHFFISFSPSHYLHPHCSSRSLCWVEVWKPNSIKSETHRTRRSQPHKSPWA